MAGIFLTRAPSRSPVVKTFSVSIPGGNTVTVDSVPYTDRISAKWLVTVKDGTNTKVQSYEVLGNYLTGKADPEFSVHAMIGDRIKNRADVVLSGGEMALEVTNLGTSTLTVDALRFDLSA